MAFLEKHLQALTILWMPSLASAVATACFQVRVDAAFPSLVDIAIPQSKKRTFGASWSAESSLKQFLRDSFMLRSLRIGYVDQ